MVKSMTGYGRAREMRSGRDITVEVRSVNNRYLDCTVKLPRAYIFAEDAIKTRVQKAISRGKVDVFVTIDTSAADVAVVQVNEGLAKGYYDALTLLKERFTLPGEITPEVLARFPDVLTVTKAEEDVEAIAADICAVLDDALAAYNAMRTVEGEKLALDVGSRVDTIEETVGKVEVQSPQTRLRSHIAQLRDMLQSSEPVGRKLDFLIQEVNRECNTIGSKCNDLTVARDVVNMKAEVEKIREQVQNME